MTRFSVSSFMFVISLGIHSHNSLKGSSDFLTSGMQPLEIIGFCFICNLLSLDTFFTLIYTQSLPIVRIFIFLFLTCVILCLTTSFLLAPRSCISNLILLLLSVLAENKFRYLLFWICFLFMAGALFAIYLGSGETIGYCITALFCCIFVV